VLVLNENIRISFRACSQKLARCRARTTFLPQ
jgi:hypothetical protein